MFWSRTLIGVLAILAIGETGCTSVNSSASQTAEQSIRPRSDGIVVDDRSIDARITYRATTPARTFVAAFPIGSSFSVEVDGNADGHWGHGVYEPGKPFAKPTDDRAFGSSGNGPCPQYIYAASAIDSDKSAVSSECGVLASKATYEESDPDRDGMITATIRIPEEDLFGDRPEAHIAFRIWDGRNHYSFYSARRPLVVSR